MPETDALTFFEEEILSPIQHIVRIFTLHATGQCELRGHVGNLFQNGPQYVRSIPAAIGDMKMLLIRRCPKDPNRKQRIPFLVSRRRLERALHRVCRPLSEGGSLALQAGALTPGNYVDLVKPENLLQFSDTEVGEEPEGLEVQVVEQTPWERVERKLFVMWMSCNLELQMAAEVRLLHEPQEDAPRASDAVGMSLRTADATSQSQQPGVSAGMSLRTASTGVGMLLQTTDATSENEPPGDSAGMSLRTAKESVGMSLRTADATSESQHPGDTAGMSLRTAKESVDMSLRTVDTPSENQQPGDSAGMSLRTARPREQGACLQEVERVEALWTNLRAATEAKFPGDVGGKDDLVFSSLASYLSLHLKNKTIEEVENILHDEFTAVQELASWEEPLVSEGLWSPEDLGGQQTEQELKEDLWDAVCKANESTSSKSSIRRFGAARVKGVPHSGSPYSVLTECLDSGGSTLLHCRWFREVVSVGLRGLLGTLAAATKRNARTSVVLGVDKTPVATS